MPRAPKKVKRKPIKPKLEIKWEVVDELLEAHASGTMVASTLGMHPDTLYDRCQQEKGVTFSAYAQSKQATGKAVALATQYKMMKEGSVQAMIWFCTNKLSESSKVKQEVEVQEAKPSAVKFLPAKQIAVPDDGNNTVRN